MQPAYGIGVRPRKGRVSQGSTGNRPMPRQPSPRAEARCLSRHRERGRGAYKGHPYIWAPRCRTPFTPILAFPHRGGRDHVPRDHTPPPRALPCACARLRAAVCALRALLDSRLCGNDGGKGTLLHQARFLPAQERRGGLCLPASGRSPILTPRMAPLTPTLSQRERGQTGRRNAGGKRYDRGSRLVPGVRGGSDRRASAGHRRGNRAGLGGRPHRTARDACRRAGRLSHSQRPCPPAERQIRGRLDARAGRPGDAGRHGGEHPRRRIPRGI